LADGSLAVGGYLCSSRRGPGGKLIAPSADCRGACRRGAALGKPAMAAEG